jgi:hypothetical protein
MHGPTALLLLLWLTATSRATPCAVYLWHAGPTCDWTTRADHVAIACPPTNLALPLDTGMLTINITAQGPQLNRGPVVPFGACLHVHPETGLWLRVRRTRRWDPENVDFPSQPAVLPSNQLPTDRTSPLGVLVLYLMTFVILLLLSRVSAT